MRFSGPTPAGSLPAGDASGYASWRTTEDKEPSGGVLSTQSLGQLFADAANRNFTPIAGSNLVDTGIALTTTTSADFGVVVAVVDSSYFFDGYGLTTGDSVRIGGKPPVLITSINESTHELTLAKPTVWASGASVNLAYAGLAPEIGAVELGVCQ